MLVYFLAFSSHRSKTALRWLVYGVVLSILYDVICIIALFPVRNHAMKFVGLCGRFAGLWWSRTLAAKIGLHLHDSFSGFKGKDG